MRFKTINDLWQHVMAEMEKSGIHCGHGTESIWDESLYLIWFALDLPMPPQEAVLTRKVTNQEVTRVLEWLKKRCQQKTPLPYLMHKAYFTGLEFYIDERVIIPRSPLAETIEAECRPWVQPSKVKRILDLCCGSGCIGIACAHAFPKARVDCADISEDALEVAKINIKKHQLTDRIRVIHSDGFSNITDRYDLIITNPPYVDEKDFKSMPKEYHHEPKLALVSGADGLDFVRRLLREVAKYLNEEGVLICEVGNSKEALEFVFPDLPFTWLSFSHGGEGVFMLTYQQLTTNLKKHGRK